MRVAIIIPALNEAETIRSVLEALRPAWQAVVVDDGSTDETARVSEAAGAKVLRHETNLGYDAALTSGLNFARDSGFEVAVTIDADGQIPPRVVAEALADIESGKSDLVIGRRSRFGRWSEIVYSAYIRYRYGIADILCGMKAYRLGAFEFIPDFLMGSSIGTSVALAGLRAGLRWSEIAVPVNPRTGASRFGSGIRANWRILKAMAETVRGDFNTSQR